MFHNLWVEWFAGKFKILAGDGKVACHAVNALEAGIAAAVGLAGNFVTADGVYLATALWHSPVVGPLGDAIGN